MNLVCHRGLNCHLSCVVNIAHSLGVNYIDSFGTLWSETDFMYDPKYRIYSSKRVLPNLEALGIKIEVLNCESNIESIEGFSLIPEGELFIVGMDTFHIPWSLVYQNFHQPHFFFAQKEKQGFISCFDPTYNQNNLRFMSGDIAPYAFELSRICKLPANPAQFGVSREALNILDKHPETRERLRAEINKCKNKERGNITPFIKRITAMINNRYLFQLFLRQYPFSQNQQFFDRGFLSRWDAVKNGLYKAYIIRSNEGVVDEVCSLFLDLIREEIGMAKEIAAMDACFAPGAYSVP